MFAIFMFILSYSITGMIIDRNLFSKFLICYELVLFSITVDTLLRSCDNYELIIILFAIFNGINLSILLIIIFVSNVVLMNAIDYLGIIESVLFLVYIRPLQFSMIMFILSNDLLISFINWDLLGITSYLLINY